MWPNGALADILLSMRGTVIDTSMCEYDSYLLSRGADLKYWSLERIAAALEEPCNPNVLEILEIMKTTTWSDQFDRMHGIIDEEYGPELADLFNVYNIIQLIRSKI